MSNSSPTSPSPRGDFSVLAHESQSEYDTLALALYEQFNPEGEHELYLVDTMAHSRWRLLRCDRLEDQAFAFMLGETASTPDSKIIAYLAKNGRDPLASLQRYRASAGRSYTRAQRELQQARRANAKFQDKAMDQFIENQVFGPTPGERAAANGSASQKASSAPGAKAAALGNLALRL